MRALRCVLVVLGLCLSAAATAQGAQEPFDYPLNDNLAGANGGVGFDGPWTVTANGPSSAVTGAQSGVIVAGLSYSDALGQVLPVSGGAWQANSSLAFGQGQRGTVAVPGGAVSSSYCNDGRSRDIGNAAGKTTLMVMRLDIASSASDTMHARLNPVVGQPLSAPQLIGSFRNYASLFSGLSLVWGDQRQFDFDELRASLTPPAGFPTLVVDTTSDDGSVAFQACTAAPGDCSLRGAITKANLDDAADTLHFAIPGSDPGCDASGVCRIAPQGVLPTIAKPLTIDGYTQPGASANTIPAPGALDSVLKIEIDGSGVAAAVPAILNIGAAGPTGAAPLVILRGLAIGGVPSNNGTNAVNFGFRSADSRVEGCYLGTDASGNVARSAQFGVLADESVTIGGDTPAARNLVSRNRSDGLRLAGAPRVEGNLIGLRRDGLAELPNSGDGIRITSNCSAPFPNLVDNRIAGNAGRGLFWTGGDICSSDAGGALSGNVFGLAVDGNPLGNAAGAIAIAAQGSGLDIGGLAAGQGNTIAQSFGNPGHGIAGLRRFVRARGNAWSGNAGLGLSIGAAAGTRSLNDVGDDDSFNTSRQQNWPEISAPSQAGNQLNLSYRVDSEFDAGAAGGRSVYPLTVDFYRANGDEGEVFLGSDTYESGHAQQLKAIALTLPVGVSFGPNDVVVATAIDAQGNQSEFNFYRIQSLAILSDDPDPSPAGVPYTVTVRAEAVPGEPFAPNGRVRIVDGRGGECRATLVPTATPLRSEGSCELLSTGAPGAITLTASLPATESAFARVDGTSVANATASHTVTAGIEALELVAGSGQTAAVGDAFALPLQVRALGAGGAPIAGVSVQFEAPASGASASFAQNPVTTGADGIASVVATAITTSGNYSVTARVGALTQTFALTNEPGLDTALEIVSHLPNPSNPGQAVTVTIALNPEAGGPPPTGSVAVSANTGEACTIVLPAVSCSLLFTTVGERPIQAFYPGDGAYTSSKAAFATHTVANTPSLRIGDVSQNEGNAGSSALVFTVTLDNPTGAAVSVDYATADDSAVAPGDYSASAGTLNFSGSTTTQTISVPVAGDSDIEADERLFVNLSNASGAALADAQAKGTILNDDAPVLPAVSIDDVIVQEPVLRGLTQTRARFTVTLDRPAAAPASVRVRTLSGSAIQGQDFDGNDFVLGFSAGQRQKTLDVFIRDDLVSEPTETFSVELSQPQGLTIARTLGAGSILDDGPDASLTVNSAADPGDGVCTPADCTLREAILRAGQLQSVRIAFAIPGSGPHRILLNAPLPILPSTLHTIDGYTQPGSRPNSRAIGDPRGLDADLRIVVDASAIGGGGFTLQHGGTLRGLALVRVSVNARNAFNGRPTRIVGNYIGSDESGTLAAASGVVLTVDGRSADGLVDLLVGGDGADRNLLLGTLSLNSNNAQLRAGTRIRIEGNLIGGLGASGLPIASLTRAIAITDDNPNGIASALTLVGNVLGGYSEAGVALDPGSSVSCCVSPGLKLDASGNWFGTDSSGLSLATGNGIEVLPGNFRQFEGLRFVADHFGPGQTAARIHALSGPNRAHRVLVVPASMAAQPAVIDLAPFGATPNDIGDNDSGPNELLNFPELLAVAYNDRGDRLRIRYRMEPASTAGDLTRSVAHFYAEENGRRVWLGARPYGGGIDEFDLALGRRLPLDTAIHALHEREQSAPISSELATSSLPLAGNQLLAQAAATRENAGPLRFAIRSERPLAAPRSMRFRSIDASARAGSDYAAVDGSVQAPAGEFEVFVDVPLLNDALVERAESFQLEVWSEEDFGLGSALVTGSIVDEDVVRPDVRQFDTLNLDALDGRRGFRIEHARADEAVLVDLGDFDGAPGSRLALAISEVGGDSRSRTGGISAQGSLQLLPALAPPFAATLSLGRFQPNFYVDTANEGAALLPATLGRIRGAASRPSIGLRGNDSIYLIHGRDSLPASGSIQSLASGADGQTLALSAAVQRIVAVGDVNGDGREDAAVAVPPRAFLLLGRNDGAPLVLGPAIQANGPEGVEILQIAGAGDLNGDGRDDLVVRGRNAAGYSLWLIPGRTNFTGAQVPDTGQAQIVDPFASGGAAELADTLEFVSGDTGFVEDGNAAIVDFLAIAAPASDGGLTLLFGGAPLQDVVDPLRRQRILPAFPGDRTGQGLAVLPDFDGNGGAELAIGIPGAEAPHTGSGRIAILHARLQPGTLSLADAGDSIQWLVGQQEQRAGWRLAALPDVDGDGLDDLGVSAPAVGRSYVVFSSERIFSTSGEERPPPAAEPAVYSSAGGGAEIRIGRSAGVYNEVELLPAGDFDGDGRGDVLIGQPSVQALDAKAARRAGRAASVAGEGAIALLLSSGQSLPPNFGLDDLPLGAVRIRRAEDPEQPLAVAYAAGGDYNGDGRTDLAFLAGTLDRIAIVHGRGVDQFSPAFLDPFREADDTLQPCTDILRLAQLGDVDGDGFDDLGVLCPTLGGQQLSALKIHFGSATGFSGVASINGVRNIGSAPSIGPVRNDGSGADSFVLAQEGGGATIIFGGPHMRADPVALNGHTLRLVGGHLSDESAVRVIGLGQFDDQPGADIGIAHSPPSRDGSPVGQVEILSGRASFPALLDLRDPPAATIQGQVLLRGSGVHAITSLDSLSDRNGDGRRELLIGLGEAEGHAPGSGKVFLLHGFALPGLGAGTEVREIDDMVPVGAGLTIRNAAFRADALVQVRAIRDFDGPGLDAIGFGAQSDDLRGLVARKGRLVIIRAPALPPP